LSPFFHDALRIRSGRRAADRYDSDPCAVNVRSQSNGAALAGALIASGDDATLLTKENIE
jgi:hypothetical protein